MANINQLVPILCMNCGKKIGETKMIDGIVSIKCPKCSVLNTIETKPAKSTQSTNSQQ